MPGPALTERFFETTRGRLVLLLRQKPRTVEELAGGLRLSDNAVRTHLATLERDGLVRQLGTRRGPGAGKPATIYEINPTAETGFSRAYAPVLLALLDELAERARENVGPEVMQAVGARLARAFGRSPARDTEAGVQAAIAVLAALGGEAIAERGAGAVVIRGCAACPLGEAVSAHPGLCHAVESLLATTSAMRVVSVCEHGERPRCVFQLTADDASDPAYASLSEIP